MDHRKKYKRALYLALLFLMLAAGKLPGQEISCAAAQEQGQAVAPERDQPFDDARQDA